MPTNQSKRNSWGYQAERINRRRNLRWKEGGGIRKEGEEDTRGIHPFTHPAMEKEQRKVCRIEKGKSSKENGRYDNLRKSDQK